MGIGQGTRIGRWVVGRLLGSGGMASVWSLSDPSTGEACALKLLELPSEAARLRFVREADLQAALVHPHIVRVLGQLQVGAAPGLLLELIDGAPLSSVLASRRLGRREALGVFHGILLAIAWAHRQGTVHRDLKPANTLLQLVPGGVVARVTDFGLAKSVAQADTGLTASGAALGTPEYMAPEQLADAAAVDLRADVFSLGAMLFELLAGRPPWRGADYGAQLAARKRPLEIPDAAEEHADLLRRCLATDPADRPADAGELLDALWPGSDLRGTAPPVPGLDLVVACFTPAPTLAESP